MAESWFAAGYRAAQLRQEGNEHFSGGRHVEAVSFYTQALAHFPDAVLLSNRAAARLRLSDRDGALRDACLAARLSKPGSRLWAKSLFRLGSALNALGTHPASALAALSTAAAWTRAEGEPLDATLRALREASAAFARASSLADDPSLVSMDTLLADLRAGRALARATSIADVEAELAAAQASAAAAAAVPASTVLASRDNVECALCVDQLYEPTVIPCGHVLCRSCLSRALDQAFDTPARCPLCRDDLAPFLCWLNVRARHEAARTRRRHEHGALQLAVCRELQAILAAYLPDEMAARAAQVRAAEAAAGEEGADAEGEHRATIPIFICSLALPGVRCPLHVFEPRYRLMMRRCIDSGRREFGMVLSPEVGYGTTLLIDEFTQLPDGRARVATTGSRRFRVLEWGNKDGYSTAKVEWVFDTPEPQCEATTAQVSGALRAQLNRILAPLRAAGGGSLRMLEEHVGPMPEDDALLAFWASAVLLQHDPQMQLILAFGDGLRTSALSRLRLVSTFASKAASARAGGAPAEAPSAGPRGSGSEDGGDNSDSES